MGSRNVAKHYLEIGDAFFGLMEKIQPGQVDWIFDTCCLPHTKEEIQQALLFRFGLEKDLQARERLVIAMQFLAYFQSAIGDEPLKPFPRDLAQVEKTEDGLRSFANEIIGHEPSFDRWKMMMDQKVLPEVRQITVAAEKMADEFLQVLRRTCIESPQQLDEGKEA